MMAFQVLMLVKKEALKHTVLIEEFEMQNMENPSACLDTRTFSYIVDASTIRICLAAVTISINLVSSQ
jgi:hypothetical protein